MDSLKYTQFNFQDFLEDDYFMQWVINPRRETDLFWESFIATYPQKKDTLQKAADAIRLYRQQEVFDNSENKAVVWQRITDTIKQAPVIPIKRTFRLSVLIRVAAAVLIVGGLFFWLNYKNTAGKTYSFATTFGEIKTFTLPDHSQVTLNGNSTLDYKANPGSGGPREVWIKGEGYFNVKHLNQDTSKILSGERFVVHCGDINIEVLGTTFNVKARHAKTNVTLITGKIRIDYPDNPVKQKPVVMAPGDYIEYAAKKLLVNKKLDKPTQVTNWVSSEISFTNATLKEIIETLKDNYGYTVTVNEDALLSLKIEGDISVNSITDLLDVVATTLNIKIEEPRSKHITISK